MYRFVVQKLHHGYSLNVGWCQKVKLVQDFNVAGRNFSGKFPLQIESPFFFLPLTSFQLSVSEPPCRPFQSTNRISSITSISPSQQKNLTSYASNLVSNSMRMYSPDNTVRTDNADYREPCYCQWCGRTARSEDRSRC